MNKPALAGRAHYAAPLRARSRITEETSKKKGCYLGHEPASTLHSCRQSIKGTLEQRALGNPKHLL